MGGGLGGALGAGLSAAAVPSLAEGIDKLNLSEPVRQAVLAAAGAAVGALAGGQSGAMAGFNQTSNNFLLHQQVDALKKDLSKCQSKSGGCSDDEASAIVKAYHDLSTQNIAMVQSCISQGDAACVQRLESQAAAPGELSGTLPMGFGPQERQLQARQANVSQFGSVKGNASLFGSDVDQAREVAQFRQTQCAGASAADCEQRLWQTG